MNLLLRRNATVALLLIVATTISPAIASALTNPNTPTQVNSDFSQYAPNVPVIPVLEPFSISSEDKTVHLAYTPTPRPLVLISITRPLPADVAPTVAQLQSGKPAKLFLKHVIGVLAISNEFTISASGEGAKKAIRDFAKGKLKWKSPLHVGVAGNVLTGQGFINLEYSKSRQFPGITIHSPEANIFIFAFGNGGFGLLAVSPSAAMVWVPQGIKMVNSATDYYDLIRKADAAGLYSPYVQLGGYTINFVGK